MAAPAKQLWLVLCLLLLIVSRASGALSIVDDRGKKITLPAPPERIVCLYGALTEIVAALGRCEAISGVTAHETYPPCIRNKVRVGTHLRPNLEIILSLKPDLVLQGSVSRGGLLAVRELERHGLKVAVFNPYTVEMVFSTIERVGVIIGRAEKAKALTSSLKRRLSALEARVARLRERPKVFYEVSYPTILAAGRKHIVNDLIEKAGGENVIRVNKKFARVSPELIIKLAPEVYIVQKGPMNKNPLPVERRPYFQVIPAVKEGRVYYVDEFLFARPGPRIVDALEEMIRLLHPGLL